ncbi:TetR/AcrR family transcriptional regulator [Streptomyces caatingaensis]|uniref:TetR family transcriptional regulator n=1 Tax=Streptomyces caatingaensis TaxID=1678637 RepID=A0A0K9XGZ9_9ACTN|nr:TetR/AcrR family transcriptional regulator [Streptomyces caatingaensis]KNB52346.1 TetR family transcriptional regulator [Streptomyces caatingaensis]
MTERPPHGTARPGGRTARTREAVLAAALEELGVHGYAALTVDRIAQRSGVHAATIRRRWRSVQGVIIDLLAQHSGSLPTPDTGDLRQDLHELARAIADYHASPRSRNFIEATIVAAAHNPQVSDIVRDAFTARTEQVTCIVTRAVARGELSPDVDAREVIAALSAPFYYRLLVLRGTADDRLVHTSAEAAYHAARGGVFVPPPSGP